MIRRFRFSLRTWFVLLTISTCLFALVLFVQSLQRRQSLQQKIVERGTLTYNGHCRYSRTETVSSSVMPTHKRSPHPYVWLRDWSTFPWASRLSEGAVAFSEFDAVEGCLGVPEWMRDILATGELRKLELRQLRDRDIERLGVELIGQLNHGLEKLWLTNDRGERLNLGSSLKGLERLDKLHTLTLLGAKADYLKSLPHGLPPNLNHLSLVGCELTTEDAQILAPCTQLETVNLWGNPAAGLTPLVDIGLPSTLKILNLSETNTTKYDLRALRNCSQLEELDLTGTGIDLRDCDEISLPKSLVKLKLDKATLDASSFRMIAALPNLETLEINESTFEDADLEGIQLSQNLKLVWAHGTNAGNRFAKSLAKAEQLESLNFHGIEIEDETLFALGKKPKLRTLFINSKRITDASASWFKSLTKLYQLRLNGASVTDEFFNVAPHLKEIGDLRLDGSGVSAELKTEIRESAQKRRAQYREQMDKIMGRSRNSNMVVVPGPQR